MLSVLLFMFLIPWVVLIVWHFRRRRTNVVIKEVKEQKNTLLLALTEEGRIERSKMRSNNGEAYSNTYARESRFARVAFLARERVVPEIADGSIKKN